MSPEQQSQEVARHLKRVVRREGWTLGRVSTEVLERSPDYLSRVVRGQRPLRVADLFEVLGILEVTPQEFFLEALRGVGGEERRAARDTVSYSDPAELGLDESVREFIEDAARRAVVEVIEERRRRMGKGARSRR